MKSRMPISVGNKNKYQIKAVERRASVRVRSFFICTPS